MKQLNQAGFACMSVGRRSMISPMSALVFDIIRRYLEYSGYTVIHAMNFADVDDKIIARANREG